MLFSHSVTSDSLRLHGLKDTMLPCPLPLPRACSNSFPLKVIILSYLKEITVLSNTFKTGFFLIVWNRKCRQSYLDEHSESYRRWCTSWHRRVSSHGYTSSHDVYLHIGIYQPTFSIPSFQCCIQVYPEGNNYYAVTFALESPDWIECTLFSELVYVDVVVQVPRSSYVTLRKWIQLTKKMLI